MSAGGSPEYSEEIRQAFAIARRANMFIVTVREKGGVAFVLYRKSNEYTRSQRIAKRSDPAEMLKLVRTIAAKPKPAPSYV